MLTSWRNVTTNWKIWDRRSLKHRRFGSCWIISIVQITKLRHAYTLQGKITNLTFKEIVHVWKVKLHASSLRNIQNCSDSTRMKISREDGVERGLLMQLGWTIEIRRLPMSGKRLFWTFLNRQGTTLLTNGTNCPSWQGGNYLEIQICL